MKERQRRSLRIELFEDHLALERGLSPRTVDAYRRDLARFADHLDGLGVVEPDQIDAGHVRGFVYALHARGRAPSTIRRTVSALRTWARFLVDEEVISTDPTQQVETPRAWRTLPDTLSVEEVERVLEGVDPDSPSHWRDRALLEVLYASGMRVSELVGLELDAVHLDEGLCRVLGKGAKERFVPLGRTARVALTRYLAQERPLWARMPAERAVFLNQRGGRLSRTSVWTVVKKAVERAGVAKKVSPHTFRHSCATHLLEGGADLAVVQELLGHADIATTEIYTHVDRAYLQGEHRRYHPRGN